MKYFRRVSLMILCMMLFSSMSFAKVPEKTLDINILTPVEVKGYPGIDETVKVRIENLSQNDMNQLLVYITMADVKKNMTVNLEDYGADVPVYLDVLKAGESKVVELPIRFVYTSKYDLYVTVVSKDSPVIQSSEAITIEIFGNTKINKNLAMVVTISEPILLLGLVSIVYFVRSRKYKVRN